MDQETTIITEITCPTSHGSITVRVVEGDEIPDDCIFCFKAHNGKLLAIYLEEEQ